MGRRMAGSRFKEGGLHSAMNWMGERHISRALGWGGLVGAANVAYQTGGEAYDFRSRKHPGMALAGEQVYDPSSGQGPRRSGPEDDMASAGLVQALHKLR